MMPRTSGLSAFDGVVADEDVVARLVDAAPSAYNAASAFWRAPMEAGHLTPRMCELILLAMHATPTALNTDGIRRHLHRAREAGATDEDILDVLFTISAVANHALYFAVPILEDELRAGGDHDAPESQATDAYEAAKQDFISTRGFWNVDRERFARLMPEYFLALNAMSTDSWKNGSLSSKERDLVCIAIDCTVTHKYEPGLRLHIRNAVRAGATRAEILQVFELAALIGLEGYILGAHELFGRGSAETR